MQLVVSSLFIFSLLPALALVAPASARPISWRDDYDEPRWPGYEPVIQCLVVVTSGRNTPSTHVLRPAPSDFEVRSYGRKYEFHLDKYCRLAVKDDVWPRERQVYVQGDDDKPIPQAKILWKEWQ